VLRAGTAARRSSRPPRTRSSAPSVPVVPRRGAGSRTTSPAASPAPCTYGMSARLGNPDNAVRHHDHRRGCYR
jgi:hypothetical protein